MTPEQEQRRKTRERWRAEHPAEWRERRRRARQRSGNPAAGLPDRAPDRPDCPALRDRVAALEAELAEARAELAELRAYHERDVERSRRNRERRRARSAARSPGLATGARSNATGSPPSRDWVNTPPETGGGGVFLSTGNTTTTQNAPETSDGRPAVWTAPDVVAAIERRPGLDVELLRGKIDDWLREDSRRSLNIRTALSFIERSRPGAAPNGRHTVDLVDPRPAGRCCVVAELSDGVHHAKSCEAARVPELAGVAR